MQNCTLMCADNVLALRKMQENSVDACITDPPYGMNMASWDHHVPPLETWQEVYRVLKPGAFVLSFCSPELYHRMAVTIEDAGFRPMDMIFWMVTTKMAKKNRLKPAHEPIFVGQKKLAGSIKNNQRKWGCGEIDIKSTRVPWEKKPPTFIKDGLSRRNFGGAVVKAAAQENRELEQANPNGRYPSNVIGMFDNPNHQKYFYAPRVTRKERGANNNHPTPKPIDLMRYLVQVYAPPKGVVLDPFMGSGSTGIGALQQDCRFIGIDSAQHYVDIANKRIKEHHAIAECEMKAWKIQSIQSHIFGGATRTCEAEAGNDARGAVAKP